jgi:hypothetical protein
MAPIAAGATTLCQPINWPDQGMPNNIALRQVQCLLIKNRRWSIIVKQPTNRPPRHTNPIGLKALQALQRVSNITALLLTSTNYKLKFLQTSFLQTFSFSMALAPKIVYKNFLQWRWRHPQVFFVNFCRSKNPLVVGGGPAMQLLIPNSVNT